MFGFARNFVRWITGKSKKRSATIVVVGLDNAGKTTMMNCINGLLDEDVTPTIGQTTPIAKKVRDFDLQILDLGGHERFRQVWSEYYSEMHAVVFVVDAADSARMEEMVKEFDVCAHHPGLKRKPLLVFANKQDLPGALDESEIARALRLDTLESCSHNVMKVVAKRSANGGKVHPAIAEGLAWIVETLNKNYEEVDKEVRSAIEVNKIERARKAEERRRRVEERKKNPEPAVVPTDPTASSEATETPMCRRCSHHPATRKCEASNWLPVCDDCCNALMSVATPPSPPDDQIVMPDQGSLLAPSVQESSPRVALTPSPRGSSSEKVESPAETILCSVCHTSAAVKKSEKHSTQLSLATD